MFELSGPNETSLLQVVHRPSLNRCKLEASVVKDIFFTLGPDCALTAALLAIEFGEWQSASDHKFANGKKWIE